MLIKLGALQPSDLSAKLTSPTFPRGHPAHVTSLWLDDEAHSGSSRKEFLQRLQVSRVQGILDDHVLTHSCWRGAAGAERRPVSGLLPQHITAGQGTGGQPPPALVPPQHVFVLLKGAQGRGSEDKAALRHAAPPRDGEVNRNLQDVGSLLSG